MAASHGAAHLLVRARRRRHSLPGSPVVAARCTVAAQSIDTGAGRGRAAAAASPARSCPAGAPGWRACAPAPTPGLLVGGGWGGGAVGRQPASEGAAGRGRGRDAPPPQPARSQWDACDAPAGAGARPPSHTSPRSPRGPPPTRGEVAGRRLLLPWLDGAVAGRLLHAVACRGIGTSSLATVQSNPAARTSGARWHPAPAPLAQRPLTLVHPAARLVHLRLALRPARGQPAAGGWRAARSGQRLVGRGRRRRRRRLPPCPHSTPGPPSLVSGALLAATLRPSCPGRVEQGHGARPQAAPGANPKCRQHGGRQGS